MMKKLLVLALVLSLVGYVNAGLVTGDLVAGKLTYSADLDTKIVSIIASAPVTTLTLGALIPSGPGLLVKGTVATANGGPGDYPVDLGFEATDYPAGTLVYVSASTGGQTGFAGTIMTIGFSGLPDFIAIADETVWGGMVSGVSFQDGQEVSLTGMKIVPEPMTMLLLGLGGLFLRRK